MPLDQFIWNDQNLRKFSPTRQFYRNDLSDQLYRSDKQLGIGPALVLLPFARFFCFKVIFCFGVFLGPLGSNKHNYYSWIIFMCPLPWFPPPQKISPL